MIGNTYLLILQFLHLIRYVGASNGYKYDSVTLFEKTNFAGYNQDVYKDSKILTHPNSDR